LIHAESRRELGLGLFDAAANRLDLLSCDHPFMMHIAWTPSMTLAYVVI
jgi:hypothetical protein